ncbi:hypothetical protein HOG48_05480, partial [Candidatus Peregrinibacteria bacterium]|nr:hypothetical protein [Candidatus Peregrinibacteria bacterium]
RIAKGEASDLDESWKEVVLPLYRLVKNYALHIFSNLKELVALWEDTYPEDVVGGTLCFEMDGTMMLVRTEGLKRYEVKLAGDLSGAEHF